MKKLIFAALLAVSSTARAQVGALSPPENGNGEAAVENGNVKLAREQAMNAAMRDALVKAAGVTIDTASVVEGGVLVQDRIFAHANGYIKSYTIGKDGVTDGVYEVSLHDVKVGLGDLSKDMDAVHAMLMQKAHPRLYMLIREQSFESLITGSGKATKDAPMLQLSQGVVEQRMSKELLGVGWRLVDPQVASGKVHVENAASTDLAGLNGRDFSVIGADFVALGSVIVRPTADSKTQEAMGVTGAAEIRAVINIKATDTGDTVASIQKSIPLGSGMGNSIAAVRGMEKVADEAIADLSKQVLERWRKDANGVGNLHVLASVADYDVLQAFEEQIQKGVANVKSVDEVSFNDGKADLSVMLAGTNPKQLANSINNKSVKGTTVKVTRVTTNTVEVKLVK